MRAIVTGSAAGIGRATAFKLHSDAKARDESSQLMLADIQGDKLEEVAGELRAEGAEVEIFAGDLTDVDVPSQLVEATVKVFGGLDVLISNAGIIKIGTLMEIDLEDYERAFAINTRATWLLVRAAHKHLKAARGCIVVTGSISSVHPTPPLGAYSASKAALRMMVKQLSIELGPDGIRCNMVSPGSTHTAMTDARYSNPELRAEAAKKNPLQTVGQPQDQAAAIAFMASPAAAYITGENLLVDGGMQNMLMPASAMGDPTKK